MQELEALYYDMPERVPSFVSLKEKIFVINVGGYIGESTKREIAYATKTGKKINYLEP